MLFTVPLRPVTPFALPLPRLLHVPALKRATPFAGRPPAVVKAPPTYSVLPETCNACTLMPTPLPRPLPSALHAPAL